MGYCGKTNENQRKSRKTEGNQGKSIENPLKIYRKSKENHGKSRENQGKSMENPRKIRRSEANPDLGTSNLVIITKTNGPRHEGRVQGCDGGYFWSIKSARKTRWDQEPWFSESMAIP